ncbi:MAG: sigma-70 family RNA polymerase sigma factor [Actinomycetota bacterium]|nr:sigma-70 family RNA polymerase sigma factor [Actinomycetota bacterium]
MAADDFADFYAAGFRTVSAAVRAFCGNADVAHEATQEAFARAYARWPRVRDSAYPQAWVTKTAINLTRRHFRSRSGMAATTDSAGPSADRVDLLSALRALPERQRQAVVLHYLIDSPLAAVAEVMGISEGAVKAHLFKARAALRGELEVGHA